MIRTIIEINEEKCNGCGACAKACHEGAINMVNGKAKLTREDYCDGLGDCLPTCPTGAIKFVQREAPAYDEEAVMRNKAKIACTQPAGPDDSLDHSLINWPVQIKLAPINAPYFNRADLLIAADCTAYAYGGFHAEFMREKVTLIGCTKLDSIDYSEKLAEIFRSNNINSITVARMEVPCCRGIVNAVMTAISLSGKSIECRVAVISRDGKLLSFEQ